MRPRGALPYAARIPLFAYCNPCICCRLCNFISTESGIPKQKTPAACACRGSVETSLFGVSMTKLLLRLDSCNFADVSLARQRLENRNQNRVRRNNRMGNLTGAQETIIRACYDLRCKSRWRVSHANNIPRRFFEYRPRCTGYFIVKRSPTTSQFCCHVIPLAMTA